MRLVRIGLLRSENAPPRATGRAHAAAPTSELESKRERKQTGAGSEAVWMSRTTSTIRSQPTPATP
jgi:hypothetical protein